MNEKTPNKHIVPEWPLNSECVDRPIMKDKMPNKHYLPETRSYTLDSEKNDWLEEPHNFYFFEGEDAKVIYHYYREEESEDKNHNRNS